MDRDKVVSSSKKVVEGIREAFEGLAHMLDGVVEQLEEMEQADGVGEMPERLDMAAVGSPAADTTGKKPAVRHQRKTPEKKAKPMKEATCETVAAEKMVGTVDESVGAADEPEDTKDGAAAPDDPDTAEADTLPFEPPEDTEQENVGSPSSITKDDITSVIVAKIKQKRSNNEKIGQLLTVYGVKALSELPAAKYEAFLADISQI